MIYFFFLQRMCGILHDRQARVLQRFDTIFNLTKTKVTQDKLLGVIHGMTKKVNKYIYTYICNYKSLNINS